MSNLHSPHHDSSTPSKDAPSDAPRLGPGLRLGRIFGVQVVLDLSLAIIFVLITTTLALGTFPAWHPEWSTATSWIVGTVAAVAFLASILAHELSHALVGRALGVRVHGITLFMFGGMASMAEESRSPKAEFLMTIVGPLTSLVIGFVGIVLGTLLAGNPQLAQTDPEAFMRSVGPAATVLVWLGPINVLLAVFNMIPGFPLDGGRVLRAIVWWATGDLKRATAWASGIGQGFGWLFVAAGVYMAFGGLLPVLGGGFVSGLWLALIGWFLIGAAKASYTQLANKEVLTKTPVRRLMRDRITTVAASTTLTALVEGPVMQTDQRSFPVYDGERLVGSVAVEDVREVPKQQWDSTTVSEIMKPLAEDASIDASADAAVALEEMTHKQRDQVPVVENGQLQGFLLKQDIVKWLMLQRPSRGVG